jgi:S-DNA-T family DNA segregation ATPase FtsK/SpoIIIE
MTAVRTKKKSKSKSRKSSTRKLSAEIWGLVLISVGTCLFLALVSYSAAEDAATGAGVNLIGPVGEQLAGAVLATSGLVAFFLNGILIFFGFLLLFGKEWKPRVLEITGYALAVPSATVGLHLLFDGDAVLGHAAGGWIGALGAEIGRSLLGSVGTTIVTTTALLLSVALILETSPSELVRQLVKTSTKSGRMASGRLVAVGKQGGSWIAEYLRKRASRQIDVSRRQEPIITLPEPSGLKAKSKPVVESDVPPAEMLPAPGPTTSNVEVKIPKRRAQPVGEQIQLELKKRVAQGFELPSTSLLTAPRTSQETVDSERLKQMAQTLENALREFKIDGHITGICPGPVVTMFEFEPAAGVKLSTISNLSNDVARIIRAQSVRIVAPIPGKGVVGFEVPNEYRETVYLREILEDSVFAQTRAKLPLAIGKDIEGNPIVADLAKMPHLLVAGSTGSGKSVAINAMVTSLLYRHSPRDLRLILVDPKMLELNVYEHIPHLLVPVVTNPAKAAAALKWAVDEMERRYYLLSQMRVRNIDSYNKALEENQQAGDEQALACERLPYIVIVIDEFADLMMVASKDVEMCVTRLAQKARAAGVHLILATQRPSVDVITGLIKANFPTRISFKVFSKVDSRTVLDTSGAEALLGMGDMLFRPPGRGDLQRVHGAYVDEKEIEQVVHVLKEQESPNYQEEILVVAESGEFDPGVEEVDEMYDVAVDLVTSSRKASISMVQRKLRVGYNRAARMIEMMERDGVVGPSDGRGGREVMAPPPPPL